MIEEMAEVEVENVSTVPQNFDMNVQEAISNWYPQSIVDFLKRVINFDSMIKFIFVSITVIIFLLIYIAIRHIFKKIPDEKMKPHAKNFILKIFKYVFEVLIIIYILNFLGVNLNALFGAAGIAGVALGLAAQTALGNIISGFFILNERAFKVGDHVKIEEVEGNVESVDLLAIKVKTFDNQIVRVSNETVIKSKLENVSSLSTRRVCLYMTVSYNENLPEVMNNLKEAVGKANSVISHPPCEVVCSNFNPSGVELRITAWTRYADFISARNNVILATTQECKRMKIAIQCQLLEIKESKKESEIV
ncbi:MAG: mechanosensitive ion channel family protein [Treponemataceae bacterium]